MTAEHVADHAATERAITRFDRLSPAAKRQVRRRLIGNPGGTTRATRAAIDPPAAAVGQWTSAPFPAPDYSIHAVMLRGGRVLLFSMGSHHGAGNKGQGLLNDGQATVWDPALGEGGSAFKDVDPPPITLDDPKHRTGSDLLRPAPVFCAGHVQLADGRVLVAGGNLDMEGEGLKLLFLFDPLTDTWVREPDLLRGRWYPSLTRLPSGRVAILGGHDEGRGDVTSMELYPSEGTPVAGVDAGAPLAGLSTSEPAARLSTGLYPQSFVLGSGRLSTSPFTGSGKLSLYEPTTGRWVPRIGPPPAVPDSYPTSFLRPGDQNGSSKLVQVGGLTLKANGQQELSNKAFTIDPERERAWRAAPSLNVARRNATSVLLPDGTAVVLGGGPADLRFGITGGGAPIVNPEERRVELWDPKTGTWSLGPGAQISRGYHSIGMLLADGRVLAGGDDWTSYLLDTDRSDRFDSTFEIYSPPYLFKGPRPVIEGAPSSVGYGETFSVEATADRPITRVALVAPGSVTHAMDQNQRVLELPVVRGSGDSYTVTGPVTSAAAPPGDYMVFALSDLGVPSVAAWVRVRPSFPGQGSPVLTPLPDEVVPTPTPTPTPEPAPEPGPQIVAPLATTVTPPPVVTPPTPVLAPPSSAVLSGRTLTVVAVLSRTAKRCPAKVTASVTIKGAAKGSRGSKAKPVVARWSATTISVGDGFRCRATGKLKFAAAPKAKAEVAVRVAGSGVTTLRLRATHR